MHLPRQKQFASWSIGFECLYCSLHDCKLVIKLSSPFENQASLLLLWWSRVVANSQVVYILVRRIHFYLFLFYLPVIAQGSSACVATFVMNKKSYFVIAEACAFFIWNLYLIWKQSIMYCFFWPLISSSWLFYHEAGTSAFIHMLQRAC